MLLLLVSFSCRAFPCTIFVLTDSDNALFCNNEDWSNTTTRVWFVPAGKGYFGCAYVGFDDGTGQGGMNTEGLAYDWVAGFDGQWNRGARHQSTWGIPTHRMLETCATVEDAIKFYREYYEPAFKTARVLVADKTGASVIIGAKRGELFVEKAQTCRGFGYAGKTVEKMLATPPEPSVANGINILRACLQEGKYATKYSNVLDLKSGDLFLFADSGPPEGVRLNLARELAKGAHYYDIPKLSKQMTEPPKPLRKEMRRISPHDFIPAERSDLDQRIGKLVGNTLSGKTEEKDYTPEMWKTIKPREIRAELKSLGDLVAVMPVRSVHKSEPGVYFYRMEFSKALLIQEFKLDAQGRVAGSDTKFFQSKSE